MKTLGIPPKATTAVTTPSDQTRTWFAGFCTPFSPLKKQPLASGSLAQLSAAYRSISTGLSAGADRLSRLPAPTFGGGAAFAAHAVAGQRAFAAVFAGVAAKVSGTSSNNVAQDAIARLQPALQKATSSMLTSFGSMPVAASDAFNRAESCGGLPFRF